MNLSPYLLSACLLFLLCSMSAQAATCNNTLGARLLIENARPYNEIGSPFTFYVYYLDAARNPIQGNHTLVQVTFNGTTYNMTNLTAKWSLTVVSNISEDVTFLVNATNDQYTCLTSSFISRWRTAFNVKFRLYKEPLNATDPARYSNEFQYVVLVNNNGKNTDDMTVYALNKGLDTLYDNTLGWLTNTEGNSATAEPTDHNTYFWGQYTTGEATVKLYEPGNYTVYVMNNKVKVPINYFYEFERPTTKDVNYMGNVLPKLMVYNQTNVSNTPYDYNNTVFLISFSKFEANTYYAFMNVFTIIVVVILYFGILFLIMWGTKGSDVQGQILVWYLLIATPIALGFMFYIQ